MARQEKPLNPAAGPLQQFAYDLRQARKAAGNPTYRALAKIAGYSASTLSEAAGGTQMPTMEVVLAYVGACGGDVEAWRERWLALGQQVDESSRPPASESEPEATEPTTGPGAPTTMPVRRSGRFTVLVTAAATAASLLTAGAVVPQLLDTRMDEAVDGSVSPCPPRPADTRFIGTTYGSGAHVRSGAGRDQPILRTIPANCQIGFTGMCIGQKVYDSTSGTPDVRWFTVDNGVVSSAVIHGNPPQALRLSPCPHSRPAPQIRTLSIRSGGAGTGSLQLTAVGPNVDIVGFAVASGLDASTREWRQITLADVRIPADGAEAALIRPPTADPVLVLAAACLGGDGPTGAVQVKQVDPTSPWRVTRPELSAAELTAAARLACQYPRRG